MELYFSNDSKFSFADVQDMDTQPSPSLANMRQPDLKIIIDNSMDDKLDSPSILSSKDPVGEIAMYVEKIKNLARKKRVSGNLWEYNTCHSCRGLLENKLLLHCSEEECSRYFCLRCMNKKYSTSCQDIYNIMKMGKWTCFSCSGICNCKICKDRFLDKGNPFFPNQLIKFEKSKRRGPRANNPAKPNEETSTEITNKLEQVQDISSQENSHALPLELKPNKSSDNVEGETLYKPEVEKEEKVEKIEQVLKTEKVEKVYKIERVVPKAPKAEKVEAKEKVDKTGKVEKVFEIQKSEKAGKKEKKEKVPKGEKVDKPEKVKKLRKVEKNEKGEKVEKPDKAEKTKKSQKDATDQKPFKIEKLETVEKVEKPEKIVEEVPKVEVVKKIEVEKPTEPKDDHLDLDDMIMITIHKNLHARSKGIARKKFRESKQVLETSSVGEELVEEKLIKDIPIKEIDKVPINEDFLNPDKVGKRGSRGIRKKLAEECHLCGKSLPGVLVAVCSVDKCHKAFCELCIHENFQQDFSAKNYNPDCWICYACGGACKCPKCGRKRVLGFKVESDDMLQRNIKKAQIKPIEKRRPKFYDPIAEEEYAMPTHMKPSNKAQTSMDVEYTARGTTEEPHEMIQAFEKIINKKRRLNKPVPVLTKQNIDNSKIISEFDIDSACITLYTAENEDELKMGL